MAEKNIETEEFRCCENCGLSVYDMHQPGWMACLAGIDVVPVRSDSVCTSHIFEEDYYELYYGKDDC